MPVSAGLAVGPNRAPTSGPAEGLAAGAQAAWTSARREIKARGDMRSPHHHDPSLQVQARRASFLSHPSNVGTLVPVNDHLVYVDDSPDGELHLSLECRRAGAATSHDVDPAACAAELGAWLDARAGRRWGAVSITTSRVHNGDMTPVLDALVARRPQLGRLALGAIAFPDFERGSYVPEDLDKDGSSWRISVLGVDRLLNALPSLEELIVQASDVDMYEAAPIVAPSLRRLTLRAEAWDPGVVTTLGRGSFPVLAHLELWLGRIAYGWGATANDLASFFRSPGLPALRHLKIISDLGEGLIDELAESALLSGLSTLDISHGVLGDEGAARLRGHFPRFAHLDRLTLTGNAITQQGAAALRDLGPNIVVGWQRMMDPEEMCFDPPMVSLFNDG